MRSSEIICECGHTVSEHQENGCWAFSLAGYGGDVHHCECMIPEETVVELHTLRKTSNAATQVYLLLDGLEMKVGTRLYAMYEILKFGLKIDYED